MLKQTCRQFLIIKIYFLDGFIRQKVLDDSPNNEDGSADSDIINAKEPGSVSIC